MKKCKVLKISEKLTNSGIEISEDFTPDLLPFGMR